jgi:tetratricopeptide (TPR) repeat protein
MRKIIFFIILILLCSCTQSIIKNYDEAILLNPNDAKAYKNRGVAYGKLGQYDLAINDFNEAIRLKPDDANSYYNRGLAYEKLGQYQRAIDNYNESIRLKPDLVDVYINRGNAYDEVGQYQRAIEDFNTAIRIKQDYAGAYYNRGVAYFRQKNNKLGCRDAQKACEFGDCKLLELAKGTGVCVVFQSYAGEKLKTDSKNRTITIPQHGELIMNIPEKWKQGSGKKLIIYPTIIFIPDKGDDFKVLITPMWNVKNDPTYPNSENIRSMIDDDAGKLLPNAVEERVDIKEFNGVYRKGYYFFLTDKAPKLGEYPYLTRAVIGVGDLLLRATILSRSKSSEGITSTIKALQEAKQTYK